MNKLLAVVLLCAGLAPGCTDNELSALSPDIAVSPESNSSSNFQIAQTGPNAWTIGVEDGADSDYNDIVIDVLGGL